MTHPNGRVIQFTAIGFVVLWFDVTLGHLSAERRHPGMWVPMLFLPCAALSAVLTASFATPMHQRLFRLVCHAALFIGLLGFAFHLSKLLKDLTGAIQWTVLVRLMRYPPLLAPLSVSGLGILGLIAQPSWPREENRRRVK